MSSLYVHIPFCNHICSYCDFCKVFYKEDWADKYLEALKFEIKDKEINHDFDTIYIGGGTPSSLNQNQLITLFELLKPFSSKVKEYSIEVNPESMDDEKLDLMVEYGINRLSIGVQSFHDSILQNIERYHSSLQAIQLINKAKEKGVKDINVDLIYGLPDQTLDEVMEDIHLIHNLDISHVSIYSLILEEHTQLKNMDYKPLSDEDDALWYDTINRELDRIGFYHYEVSNYYKKKPSYHNLVYWNYHDYEGIGLGAHSLKEHHRYENTKSISQYLNHQYLLEDTSLSKEDELFEKIMMGLRLTDGIDIEEVNRLFNVDFHQKYKQIIEKYISFHMLKIEGTNLKTTELGMKYLNNILVDFLDD